MSHSDENKILAYQLLDDNADMAETLFTKGLAAIREALRAERVAMGHDGDPVYLGPDYHARLAGIRLLAELCLGNRKPSSQPPPDRDRWTMEDLSVAIAEIEREDREYQEEREKRRSERARKKANEK